MTNNQLTDKRLAQLAKRNFCQTRGEEYTPFGDEVVSMAAELQERRKADSEPVGYFGRFDPDDEDLIDQCSKNVKGAFPLYRHAQPGPVVPDFKKLALELVGNLVDCGGLDEGVKERYLEWTEKTCRAAMLAAAPHEVKPWSSHYLPVTRGDAVGYPFNREVKGE